MTKTNYNIHIHSLAFIDDTDKAAIISTYRRLQASPYFHTFAYYKQSCMGKSVMNEENILPEKLVRTYQKSQVVFDEGITV